MTTALTSLTKSQLEGVAREMGWRGDGARTSAAAFIDWVMERTSSCSAEETEAHIQRGIDAAAAFHSNKRSPKETAMKPATSPADSAAAMSQLQAALAMIMGQPQLDMDEIRATIAEQVATAVAAMEPRRVYVTAKAEWSPAAGERVHAKFEEVCKLASIPGQNILLVGPAGCGKTQLGHQVATAMGRKFASVSCSAGMSESQVAGWLLPVGDSGKFAYVPSDFVTIYEGGGVFLFDELDAADENMLVFLNQALSNGGFFLPQRLGNTQVKRHADFVCIAAANTFGHGADRIYAGRNKLDGATLDRFRSGTVAMDYDTGLEAALCDFDALAFVHSVRAVIAQHKMPRVASTRVAIDFSKQLAAGFTMAECKARFFADWTRDERSKAGAA